MVWVCVNNYTLGNYGHDKINKKSEFGNACKIKNIVPYRNKPTTYAQGIVKDFLPLWMWNVNYILILFKHSHIYCCLPSESDANINWRCLKNKHLLFYANMTLFCRVKTVYIIHFLNWTMSNKQCHILTSQLRRSSPFKKRIVPFRFEKYKISQFS
jgi:hypothetical protein